LQDLSQEIAGHPLSRYLEAWWARSPPVPACDWK